MNRNEPREFQDLRLAGASTTHRLTIRPRNCDRAHRWRSWLEAGPVRESHDLQWSVGVQCSFIGEPSVVAHLQRLGGAQGHEY